MSAKYTIHAALWEVRDHETDNEAWNILQEEELTGVGCRVEYESASEAREDYERVTGTTLELVTGKVIPDTRSFTELVDTNASDAKRVLEAYDGLITELGKHRHLEGVGTLLLNYLGDLAGGSFEGFERGDYPGLTALFEDLRAFSRAARGESESESRED